MEKNILVTGGAGYIGSHACLELINSNYNPIVIDNFSNSHREIFKRIEKITNKKIIFIEGDLEDTKLLIKIISKYSCSAVMHFAGSKSVGESEENPIFYYKNNVGGFISLLNAMQSVDLKKFIFSSSATVYGKPNSLPITENHALNPENVYGKTKLSIENILKDVYKCDKNWRICILRYFNPVGAHESGEIGEDPKGIPNNLMPYISQVAVGKRDKLYIYGNDYETIDGTGVRDYIHVIDLAKGHIKALQKLNNLGLSEINLGTGKGYSVLQVLNSFSNVSGKNIPYEIKGRRKGDIDCNYANPSKAKDLLNWEAKLNLNKMCKDTWRWQKNNPKGYS